MWALPLSLTPAETGKRNLVFSVGLVLDPGAAVVGKRATSLGLNILGKGVGDGGRR